MRNKEIVKQLFKDVFEQPGFDEKIIEKHVDCGYVQHVDGKTLDYTAFVQHIRHLKEKIDSCDIEFLTLAEEGDIVFSNHIARIALKDGTQGQAHVIAEFHLKNGKLCYCDELTFLLAGEAKNRNLGSAY